MARDEDVKVVFSAADEYSATLNKFKSEMGSAASEVARSSERAATSSSRLQRELSKWTDAGEYVSGSMKRLRNVMEGFTFGFFAGAVSAVTQEFINMWQRSFNAEEIMSKLNKTILDQANAWKILPPAMRDTAQSTIDIYNANLALSQFYGVSKIPELKKEIEDLQKANKMAAAEIYQNTQLFGPYSAGLFNTEILNKKNTEIILQNNVTLAEKRDKLRQLVEVQGLQSTTIGKVNTAMHGETEFMKEAVELFKGSIIIRKMDNNDKEWWVERNRKMTLEAIVLDDKKSEAYERNRLELEKTKFETSKLTMTTDEYYKAVERELVAKGWNIELAKQEIVAIKALDEANKEHAAQQALRDLGAKSPYGYMSGLQEAGGLNEIARMQYEYETKLNMLRQYNTDVIVEMMNAGATTEEIHARFSELSIGYAEKEAQSKWIVYASLANQLGALSGQLYTALGEEQKAFFYLQRALAVASILINTEVAAAAAAAPPPIGAGPILGIPLATWIRATGYASAAITAATSFMGGNAMVRTSPGAPSGVSGMTRETTNAIPMNPTEQQQTRLTQHITIVVNALDPSSVNWNRIVEDNIAPAMKNATDRNIVFDIKTVQR